jgi:hypothetical protein
MTDNDTTECECPSCITARLYPPHEDPADRKPFIVGIDISTKFIAIGIVPAMGELTDTGSLIFSIDTKKQNERCVEAHYKTLALLDIIDESIDITSVAIEAPVGFGGKLLPLVGAVTAACGPSTEWYSPTTWQKVIRSEYPLPDGERMKDRIHAAIGEQVPQMKNVWDAATEDQRDSICIALAHRIETLQSTDLTEHDLRWLQGESNQ